MPSLRLVAQDLACERGGRRVFEGVGFDLGVGEVLVVTGPNGAGKSTLLRVVAGLLRRSGGTLALRGSGEEAEIAEVAHYVGHQDATKGQLTVRENLVFWARMLGGDAARADAALEAVGLLGLAEMPAARLSAGQRRRLALARLAAAARPLWLLDEPTTAIDAASEGRLLALLRGHLASGGLAIVATHAPLDLGPAQSLRLAGAS
jgi:heme exporter protein A